jgi:hypothetical protein
MVILLWLNYPYENQKCPLMFCPAGRDCYGSQFLDLPSSSKHPSTPELRPALFSALVPDGSFHRVLCRIPYALINYSLINLHDAFLKR